MSKENSPFTIPNSSFKKGFYLSEDGEWVPEGWTRNSWEDEITLKYGKAIKGYQERRSGYPVYGTNGPIGFYEEKLFDGPAVILGRKGANRGVEYCESDFWVVDTAYSVEPKNKNHSKWLYYKLIADKIGEIDDGSPIPSTPRAFVYATAVNIPPPSEQKAIAAVLGSLDDKIELLREQNETLETLAQTLFKRWFIDFNFPCLLAYGKRTQADYPELLMYGHKDFGGLPKPENNRCFIYVLRLENGNRYTGMTDFLLRRFHEHKTGGGAKATEASPPVAVIHFESFDSREAAAEREQWLKTGFGRKWLDREEEKGNLGAHVMQTPMVASEFGEIPEGWKVGGIFMFAGHVKNSVSPGKKPDGTFYHYSIPSFDDGMKPVLEDGSEIKSNKYEVVASSILVSKLNPITPRVWQIREVAANSVCSTEFQVVKPRPEYFGFVYGALMSSPVRRELAGRAHGTSSSHQRVSPSDIFDVPFPVSGDGELEKTFSEATYGLLTKANENRAQIQNLSQLRDTLLPKLMKGEIRVALINA